MHRWHGIHEVVLAVYSICMFEVEYSGHYFNDMSFLMKTAAYIIES